MSALRRIKPIPLTGVTPAIVGAELPELDWAAPTDLLVDGTYQRDLSERSTRLMRRLIETFSWNRLKPPIVVRIADGFHIIDGQHTAIVAATLGIPKIPIVIVAADSVDERARAFVGHNRDRVTVSQMDIYSALVAAGDPDAVDVANVCSRAGVRIRQMSPNSVIAEGDTAAVGIVRRLVKRRGVMKSRMVLQALVLAKRAPIAASEILASEEVTTGSLKPSVAELAAAIMADGDDGELKAHATSKRDRIPLYRALAARWEFQLKAARAAGSAAPSSSSQQRSQYVR